MAQMATQVATAASWKWLEQRLTQAHQGHRESLDDVFGFLRKRYLLLASARSERFAEEVTQETLMVVHRRFSDLTTLPRLFSFTNQVLRNKLGDAYRLQTTMGIVGDAGREQATPDGEGEESSKVPDPYYEFNLDEEMEAERLSRIICEAIEKVGDRCPSCRPILWCLYEGADADEMSEELGVPQSIIKVRACRCRRVLKEVLWNDYRLSL
jgi:RNA polymerase sigma factor (sigma-70 family)